MGKLPSKEVLLEDLAKAKEELRKIGKNKGSLKIVAQKYNVSSPSVMYKIGGCTTEQTDTKRKDLRPGWEDEWEDARKYILEKRYCYKVIYVGPKTIPTSEIPRGYIY